jgi:cysteine desulfurase
MPTLRHRPAAVAVLQAANQEVGTTQPVEVVAAALTRAGVPLVVDVAPLVGRVPLPAAGDALAADARLWGGPPGVGVLVLPTGARWRPAPGLPQAEARPVPVPLVVAAAAALEDASRGAVEESVRLSALVDRVRAQVAATVPDAVVHGDPSTGCLP